MDRVADWLMRNNLGKYASKFKKYGWDDKSLLYKMTEADIEMCIQKPGHKVKFKTAIERGMMHSSVSTQTMREVMNPSVTTQTVREVVHASIATQTNKDMECNQETELANKIAARIAVDHNISDLINIAVEKVIKSIHGDSNKTVTDTQKNNTVTCSTESVELKNANLRLKSNLDEQRTAKVTIHPDNAEELKEIETILEPPLNTLPGGSIVAAKETQERHLTQSSDYEAMSGKSSVHSKPGDENTCQADFESQGQTEGQSEEKAEAQSERHSEGQSEGQSAGQSTGKYKGQSVVELNGTREDCVQGS